MKIFAIGLMTGLAASFLMAGPDDSEWHLASYKAGRADALSLRSPVSWELEQTCVSLWANKHTLVEVNE